MVSSVGSMHSDLVKAHEMEADVCLDVLDGRAPKNPESGTDADGEICADKSGRESDEIEGNAHRVVPCDFLDGGIGSVVREARAAAYHGVPEVRVGASDHHEGPCVNGARGLCSGQVQIFGEQSGDEWNGSGEHEQDPVSEKNARTDFMNVFDDSVMVHPHDEDGEEAGDKTQIGRPLLKQGTGESPFCRVGFDVRDLEIESEKSDGDGENAVGERFEARCAFAFVVSLLRGLHGRILHERKKQGSES